MIECGVCANDVDGLVRVVKRVTIADPDGKPIAIYDLCRKVAKESIPLPPEIDLPSLAVDLHRTWLAMHQKPPGPRRLKLLKGYVFTVHEDGEPVRQPASFEGTPAAAQAAGWEATPQGWCCPGCKEQVHRPEDSEAGTRGLETFFEETKDL